MKDKPTLSGVLQDDSKDYRNRKTIGKIALWPSGSDNDKAPKFRGVLDIPDKGKFRISLWENEEEKGEKSPSLFDIKLNGSASSADTAVIS